MMLAEQLGVAMECLKKEGQLRSHTSPAYACTPSSSRAACVCQFSVCATGPHFPHLLQPLPRSPARRCCQSVTAPLPNSRSIPVPHQYHALIFLLFTAQKIYFVITVYHCHIPLNTRATSISSSQFSAIYRSENLLCYLSIPLPNSRSI